MYIATRAATNIFVSIFVKNLVCGWQKSVFGIRLTCVITSYSVQLEITLFSYLYFLILAGLSYNL